MNKSKKVKDSDDLVQTNFIISLKQKRKLKKYCVDKDISISKWLQQTIERL